ncbi:MAG TPA: hypothetical protein VN345_05825 [Blastocatellia bacterium]|nr:hypothetical protein [Blastocatellia bacterium]
MTPEELEHELELLLERQARIAGKIQRLREAGKQQEVNPVKPPETLHEGRRETREGFKVFTAEMREALDKLMLGNEAARELARQTARLLIRPAND